MSRNRFATAIVLTATLALIPCASADETTFCNTYITSLPYTIITQGHYCFNRNLSTAITAGAAITIDTDFVVLDLNNFKLGGGSAGTGTLTAGIYANNRSNLTIRNGNIRGFAYGILVKGTDATSAKNITVENNALDGNTVGGIMVFGTSYSIRNNQVSNTGGTTSTGPFHCASNPPFVTGIAALGPTPSAPECEAGGYGEVVDNTVVNTFDGSPGDARTVSIYGSGILANNRVMFQTGSVYPALAGRVCRDNTLLDIASTGYNCEFSVGANSDN